jgi:hypothetical protein
VQPLLVNSCTAAGCHQVGGKQNFQLDRAVLHGLANRRITLRNLMATLELVDKSSPRDSELVEIPRRVHGGLDHPVFGPRQDAQLEQLVDWADLVAGLSEGELPHAKPAAIAASTRSTKPAEATSDLDLPPSRFLDRSIATANFDDAKQDPLPKSRLKFGADIKSWQPKDEFDPEIFNRFAAKAAEQGPATATGPPAIRSAAVDQK